MDKDAIIKARISARTKSDFEDICRELGAQPTTKLRELVETFVRREYGRLNDRVTVHISRPTGYELGAWRVKMRLRNPADLAWGNVPVPFELPELPKRRLHPDDGFRVVVTKKATGELALGGHFVNGTWEGHLYSNGIHEGENPTPIAQVQAALAETVTDLINRLNSQAPS